MILDADVDGAPTWHDCRTGFAGMLRRALSGGPVVAALGPLYEGDPADELLAPFRRSARETGWELEEHRLCPDGTLERARALRTEAAREAIRRLRPALHDMDDWARAGLVLEIARRRGVNVIDRGLLRPQWQLKGTVTGRFGCEPVRGEDRGRRWTFNPLSLGPDDRWRVVPSGPGRTIAVMDFKAMDLCSMLSIVPGLARRYEGLMDDPHSGTATLLAGTAIPLDGDVRAELKRQLFVHAYGGQSALRQEFDERMPELGFLRDLPPVDAGRLVQAQSARAFRAALSRALPALVSDHFIPMFTVHDELVLDCDDVGARRVREDVIVPLERGASERIGVPYRVGLKLGPSYEGAKSSAVCQE